MKDEMEHSSTEIIGKKKVQIVTKSSVLGKNEWAYAVAKLWLKITWIVLSEHCLLVEDLKRSCNKCIFDSLGCHR